MTPAKSCAIVNSESAFYMEFTRESRSSIKLYRLSTRSAMASFIHPRDNRFSPVPSSLEIPRNLPFLLPLTVAISVVKRAGRYNPKEIQKKKYSFTRVTMKLFPDYNPPPFLLSPPPSPSPSFSSKEAKARAILAGKMSSLSGWKDAMGR